MSVREEGGPGGLTVRRKYILISWEKRASFLGKKSTNLLPELVE